MSMSARWNLLQTTVSPKLNNDLFDTFLFVTLRNTVMFGFVNKVQGPGVGFTLTYFTYYNVP